MTHMQSFFTKWEHLERSNPWGVNVYGPLLSEFNIPLAIREELDSRLFLDLVNQVRPNIRRIRVEGRHSESQFWLHVVLCYPFAVIGFQRNPNALVERSMLVTATPRALMACILAFHRWSVGLQHSCVRHGVKCRRTDDLRKRMK